MKHEEEDCVWVNKLDTHLSTCKGGKFQRFAQLLSNVKLYDGRIHYHVCVIFDMISHLSKYCI